MYDYPPAHLGLKPVRPQPHGKTHLVRVGVLHDDTHEQGSGMYGQRRDSPAGRRHICAACRLSTETETSGLVLNHKFARNNIFLKKMQIRQRQSRATQCGTHARSERMA